MKNIIRKIKGTNDILPDESLIWIYFENYIRVFFQKYGYKEIRTPIFESTELFLRSIGKDTDIVSKEMYSWVDQGDNNLTLRPELTASVSRSFIQNQLSKQQKSHKFYYIGSSFRRERPQKGRFRQFEQFGIESFGSPFPEQDAEIISMAYLFYKSLNIKNLNLRINTIGSREDRKKYVQSLKEYFNKFENKLTSISKKRLESNPLRILDTKIDFEIELVRKAPRIIDYISDKDKKHFKTLLNILDNMNIPYVIDHYLVRGLDYYSRTVFEVQSDTLGSQNALCGGGRYDYLIDELGGQKTPAIGFAAGIERLILASELDVTDILNKPDVYIVASSNEAINLSFSLANKLRYKKNFVVIQDTLRRSIKSQMKDANRLQAKYCIIIAEEEIKNSTVSIKNMDTGDQKTKLFDEVLDFFQ